MARHPPPAVLAGRYTAFAAVATAIHAAVRALCPALYARRFGFYAGTAVGLYAKHRPGRCLAFREWAAT